MKLKVFFTFFIVAAALTSCAPTKAEWESLHVAMEGSPKFRNKVIRDCTTRPFNARETQFWADLMNVDKRRVRTTFCNRLHQNIANGRITHADVQAVYNHSSTPNIIRVMQGR